MILEINVTDAGVNVWNVQDTGMEQIGHQIRRRRMDRNNNLGMPTFGAKKRIFFE